MNLNNNKGGIFLMSKKQVNVAVLVNSSNIDRSLRQLKKKIEREGIVRDMKRIVYFEPPTQKRRKRLIRAIKQNYLKMASKGLI